VKIEIRVTSFLLPLSKCFRYQANPLGKQNTLFELRTREKQKAHHQAPFLVEWRLMATKTPGCKVLRREGELNSSLFRSLSPNRVLPIPLSQTGV
jgi:hypothetical protein